MILITGGAGYIGSHTTHHLIHSGYKATDIVVFDNLKYGHPEHLPKGVTLINSDLLDTRTLEDVFRQYEIEAVLHFANYAYVGESMIKPYKYLHDNLVGGLNLLQAMINNGCERIVFSSSCAVYGIPTKTPIDEKEPLKPISPYGESKAVFERSLDWYNKIFGLRYVSLRYFNAGGAGYGIGEDHDPETHLIPLALRAVSDERYTLRVFGNDYETKDGFCIRDFVHVVDLAEAHLKALQYLNSGGSPLVLNLGSQQGLSVMEVIKVVEKVTGMTVRFEITHRRPGDPPVLVASSKLARSVLGWEPERDIYEIVKTAFDWHRSHA